MGAQLETASKALADLRKIEGLEFDQWATVVDSIIRILRRIGDANCSPLLIGLAEAIEDELIWATPSPGDACN